MTTNTAPRPAAAFFRVLLLAAFLATMLGVAASYDGPTHPGWFVLGFVVAVVWLVAPALSWRGVLVQVAVGVAALVLLPQPFWHGALFGGIVWLVACVGVGIGRAQARPAAPAVSARAGRMVVGLSGYAGSGKDTAAEGLIRRGWVTVSPMDKMREFVYAQNPWVLVYADGEGEPEWVQLQTLVDEVGWDRAKFDHLDVRELLQRTGTDAGRKVLGDDVWIDAAFRDAPEGAPVVVPSVRYPNEFEAVVSRGGRVFRVERPGVAPVNPHPSETALDGADFDGWLYNDGDVAHLQESLVALAAHPQS